MLRPSGVLDRVFERLQRSQIVRIRIEAVSLDSTIVKVHPDGTGALKNRTPGHRQIPRRLDHQDSSGCRGCSNGHNVCALARAGGRRPRGPGAAQPARRAQPPAAPDHGPRLRGQRDTPAGARPALHPGRAAPVHPRLSVGVRPPDIQAPQRGGAAIPQAQGLPAHLLALRQARPHVHRLHQLRTDRRWTEVVLTGPSPAVLDQLKAPTVTRRARCACDYGFTHVKEAKALMSPLPLYRAHLG
jgi:hypothetical protein